MMVVSDCKYFSVLNVSMYLLQLCPHVYLFMYELPILHLHYDVLYILGLGL
jgi:hypothetical protein